MSDPSRKKKEPKATTNQTDTEKERPVKKVRTAINVEDTAIFFDEFIQ